MYSICSKATVKSIGYFFEWTLKSFKCIMPLQPDVQTARCTCVDLPSSPHMSISPAMWKPMDCQTTTDERDISHYVTSITLLNFDFQLPFQFQGLASNKCLYEVERQKSQISFCQHHRTPGNCGCMYRLAEMYRSNCINRPLGTAVSD